MDVLEITNIAVAGGTSVLAIFTWMAARAGQVAAKAGQPAAEASRDEANATIQLAIEAQKDRELAWRPHLGLAVTYTTPAGPTNPPLLSAQFELSNVGNGPALSTTVWIYYCDSDWNRWGKCEDLLVPSKATLAPRGFPLQSSDSEPTPFPEGIFDLPTIRPRNSKWLLVATCTDVLGNHGVSSTSTPPR